MTAATPEAPAKHCPYCLCAHERPRARYCCTEHAVKAGRQNASATGKVSRLYRRFRREAQDRARHTSRWRDIAAGRNVDENLTAIFGQEALSCLGTETLYGQADGD